MCMTNLNLNLPHSFLYVKIFIQENAPQIINFNVIKFCGNTWSSVLLCAMQVSDLLTFILLFLPGLLGIFLFWVITLVVGNIIRQAFI